MSTLISNRPERPAVAADVPGGGNPLETIPESTSPTLTHYEQLADQVISVLTQITEILPKLQVPHPSTEKFVRSHRTLPLVFKETAVAGVARNARLQRSSEMDVTFSRDTLQLNQAFRPVIDKLAHFIEALKYTLDSRMAILGADALRVYYIAKGLARDPDGAEIGQLVEDLKRDLGRRGPKPKKAIVQKEGTTTATK